MLDGGKQFKILGRDKRESIARVLRAASAPYAMHVILLDSAADRS